MRVRTNTPQNTRPPYIPTNTLTQIDLRSLSNYTNFSHAYNFEFILEPNWIPFSSKTEGKFEIFLDDISLERVVYREIWVNS